MIVQDPCFVNYYGMISAEGAVPVPVQSKEENEFMLDPEDVKAAITPKTKAILINFPTNPTGAVATKENLEALAKIAIENDLYVISDEMYRKLIYTEDEFVSIAELPGMKERTIVIDGFSKAYAMTGWRVGYTAAPVQITSNMIKMQENVVSCVFEPAQRAALDAITGTGLSSEEFCNRLLEEKHVVTVPGMGFGPKGEGFIRISYATSEENIAEGLKRIQEFVESL